MELRGAIRARGSRTFRDVPTLPSSSDFQRLKMKTNARRSQVRHATIEQRAVAAQERMGRAYMAKMKPGKRPSREHNGYMRLAVYLCDLTWRVMNDRHLANSIQPTRPELEQALRLYIDRYQRKFVNDHDDPQAKRPAFHRFRYIETEQADYLAASLTTSLLRDWTPDWIEERVRRGRAGGLAHGPRKATKATPAALARLAALPESLTRQQQADALGLTLATVKRLGAQLRER